MQTPKDIPFEELKKAILDETTPLAPQYMFRLSGLEGEELQECHDLWFQIPLTRRRNLIEDLEELQDTNFFVSFESLFRIAIHDEDAKVRQIAIRSLWESSDKDLIPVLISILESDSETETRAQAASTLGRFIYLGELDELPKNIHQGLEDKLFSILSSDAPPLVRRRSLEALGFSCREAIDSHIEEAYEYGDEDWVASALFAMGRSGNSRWALEVLEKLDHDSYLVRMEAIRAAGELALEEARTPLIYHLGDPDDEIRIAAAWALSHIGGTDAAEAIETLIEESDDDTEIDFLEAALDNLAFTEDLLNLDFLDIEDWEEDLQE
jgi:HEAT repeat protein